MVTHIYYVMCIDAHHMLIMKNIELVFMLNKEIVNCANLNFGYKHGESLWSNYNSQITEPTRKTLNEHLLVVSRHQYLKNIDFQVLATAFNYHYSIFTVIETIKPQGRNVYYIQKLQIFWFQAFLIFYEAKVWIISCIRLMFLKG